MVVKKCEICGEEFEAQRDSARFCSKACKQKNYYQKHKKKIQYVPIWPDRAPDVSVKAAPVECQAVVQEAHRLVNDLARLSRTAPYQLRAKFGRLSAAFLAALEEESL